jgi:NitT/TauT family transport system permease protein
MTSSLSRFKRGFKYALIILIVLFLAIETPSVAMAVRNGVTASLISSLPADESVVLIGLALSFVRIWYVYFITVLIAVPVGVVIALHERAYNALVPLIEVIASIPGPALLPALVPFTLLAGGFAGELTAAIIIFLGMVWYVLFNVMAGIRTLPGDLWELRRSLMVSTSQAWRSIYLPAIATSFVTGSITAIGAAWNTLIVAEYFGISGETPLTQVGDGIGKIIVVATSNQGAASIVYNGVSISPGLTLALAILSMTALVVCFNLTVWRRVYHYATKRFAYNR